MMRLQNYIGGELVAPRGGRTLDNIEPATGEVYGSIPDSDAADVADAVAAAKAAYPGWSRMPASERSALMLRVAEIIDARCDELARAESKDNGKPVALARAVDIPRAAANFRFFATAILHVSSESHSTDTRAINITMRQPFGVAGLISPWNLPLYLFTWKIAPALAAGNTAVAKPSELTPATAFLLAEICREAGLPPGVLNIVHGLGAKAGAAIVEHPDVTAISFTGGTQTGAAIARTAAPMFKKLSLELGGKNPNIVFADADLDEALRTSKRAAFSNQGQICLCGSRLFVERAVYDEFVERFVAATRQIVIGDPQDERTEHGALVSAAHRDKVCGYIDLARQEGGTLRCGGQRPKGLPERVAGGYFVEPTVLTDLDVQCRVNQEEIFGPVVTITPFDDERQVIAHANSVPYGLAASVWTRDISRAHRVARDLQSGTVWVNCWMLRDLRVPFGGVKQSGVGREGGLEALRFFTEPKNVCIATPEL
ncbi:MAG: aldehyde dehydrogenase [Myxococcales bacterium]|nr:aldehyde dehydrogenase [Myxococcales bacterium]